MSNKREPDNPKPLAGAIAHAGHGIWYDTISTLAQMRCNAPGDATLIAEWQQLLQSQSLDAIATKKVCSQDFSPVRTATLTTK